MIMMFGQFRTLLQLWVTDDGYNRIEHVELIFLVLQKSKPWKIWYYKDRLSAEGNMKIIDMIPKKVQTNNETTLWKKLKVNKFKLRLSQLVYYAATILL